MTEVAAHDQAVTHSYTAHYPEHPPRDGDPHYADFEAYRNRTKATAKCAAGEHRGDYSECSLDKPLEMHHSRIEFALRRNPPRCRMKRHGRNLPPSGRRGSQRTAWT